MWPVIGEIKTYTFLYALSMLVHLGLALRYCRRSGVPLKAGFALGACYTFGMCIGARILYDVLHSRLAWRNYLDIHYYFTDGMWGGPLAYLMLAVPGVLLLARDRRLMLDLVVLTLPVPMILAKVACFFNGCCYGAPTTMFWAVAFPEGAEAPAGIARHPTQLYEIIVLAVILVVFWMLDRRRWKGTLVFWFVALYGLGRPLSEWLRDAEAHEPMLGPLSASQVVCIAAALVSFGILAVARGRWTFRR